MQFLLLGRRDKFSIDVIGVSSHDSGLGLYHRNLQVKNINIDPKHKLELEMLERENKILYEFIIIEEENQKSLIKKLFNMGYKNIPNGVRPKFKTNNNFVDSYKITKIPIEFENWTGQWSDFVYHKNEAKISCGWR